MSVRTVLTFLIWSTFSSFLRGIKGQTLDPTHSPSLSTIPTEAPIECTATLPIQFSTRLLLTTSDEETVVVDEVSSLLEEAVRVSYNTEMENTFSLCHPSFREVRSATLVNEEGSASSLTFNIIGACEDCEASSDIFDVISKDAVLSSLVSYIESRSSAVVISGITEVDSVPCEDSLQDFSEDVLIELLVDCPEGLVDLDLQAVANAFVSTYNDLAYCDPYFRFLVGAVVDVDDGQIKNSTFFPIALQVAGVCDGCDPSTVSIYELPSTLNSTLNSTLSDTSRRLVESRPAASFLDNLVSGVRNIAHESGHKQQRDLQSSCYCDAQAIAERAPFESEFIGAFRKSVESMDIECVSSVRDCHFGTKFETSFLITLEENEALATVEMSALEDAFKAALNSLFEPTAKSCNPDFRVVESAKGRFDGFEVVGLRRKTQEGLSDSASSTSAPSPSPTSTNPVLPPTLAPTPLFGGHSPSSSPSSTNPVLPPTLFPTMPREGNSPLITTNPVLPSTLHPTRPTEGNSPPIRSLLMKTSGSCNGCRNDLFFHDDVDDVVNRRELYINPFERILQQDGAATSKCYCPIDAEETTKNPTELAVIAAFEDQLDERQIPLIVKGLTVVEATLDGGVYKWKPISPPTAATSSEPPPFSTQFPSEFPSSILPTQFRSEFPSSSPTQSPSESPQFPSEFSSPLPTQFPSEFPSSLPTQFPSEFPSPLPTQFPSEFPSSLPTQFPSEFPSPLPTQFPSEFPSPFPTQFPSEFPVSLPTQFPSESPHFPSKFPSPFPTQSPSEFPSSLPTQFPLEFPPNETPAILCGEFGEECSTPGDCCSNRCIIYECKKQIPMEAPDKENLDKEKLEDGGRGGSAGTGGGKRLIRGRKLVGVNE
jgi:hypothetical protein